MAHIITTEGSSVFINIEAARGMAVVEVAPATSCELFNAGLLDELNTRTPPNGAWFAVNGQLYFYVEVSVAGLPLSEAILQGVEVFCSALSHAEGLASSILARVHGGASALA